MLELSRRLMVVGKCAQLLGLSQRAVMFRHPRIVFAFRLRGRKVQRWRDTPPPGRGNVLLDTIDSTCPKRKDGCPARKSRTGGPRAWGLCGLGARDPA